MEFQASRRLVCIRGELTTILLQRAQANERDIEKRMIELEKSLGGLLPRSSRIEEIVHTAEKKEVSETEQALSAAVKENPVYRKMNPFL